MKRDPTLPRRTEIEGEEDEKGSRVTGPETITTKTPVLWYKREKLYFCNIAPIENSVAEMNTLKVVVDTLMNIPLHSLELNTVFQGPATECACKDNPGTLPATMPRKSWRGPMPRWKNT